MKHSQLPYLPPRPSGTPPSKRRGNHADYSYIELMLFIRIPIAAFLKYILRSILHRFFISQLFSPFYTSGSIRTFTRVFKFSVTGSLFVFRILPIVPAFRTDMSAKLTINKSRSSIRSPRAPQIDFLNTGSGCQLTVLENITKLHLFRGRSRGNV